MGIDIYLRWDGQTEEEKKAQLTGYSAVHGHVGYLREGYHGTPYVTEFLLEEAFHGDVEEVAIPAATLRQRLPKALEIARERDVRLYNSTTEVVERICKSFTDFVELVERLELEGKNPTIYASY